MNILGQSLEESTNGSYSCSSPETASSSNFANTVHSEEEVHTLASARPKKRAGRRIFKETRHPVYRGVRRRNNNKWVCEVRVPNDNSTRIWLGTYSTPEMAARAHDVAAIALRGKSACLNFADSVWRLPLPASTNAKDIRRAAAAAAAVEDSCGEKLQNGNDAGADYCQVSSSVTSVEEDSNNNKASQRFCDLDEITVASAPVFEDMHEWLQSMADEPLRSPTFATHVNVRDVWNFVEDDSEVSLWSFTI